MKNNLHSLQKLTGWPTKNIIDFRDGKISWANKLIVGTDSKVLPRKYLYSKVRKILVSPNFPFHSHLYNSCLKRVTILYQTTYSNVYLYRIAHFRNIFNFDRFVARAYAKIQPIKVWNIKIRPNYNRFKFEQKLILNIDMILCEWHIWILACHHIERFSSHFVV